MINNNTQQKTTSNTNSVSESSIYLKKSELPKDISSFRNDVGYISASALGNWLKEHSYISKNEINALIKKANLTVVDTVNRITDDEAISRLNQDVIDIKGEIVAIKDKISILDSSSISTSEKNSFAKKNEIPTKVSQLENDRHYLTSHQSLSGYAKRTEIPDVSNFVTRDEVPVISDDIATKDWVEEQGYLTRHQSLNSYAKKSDIPDVSGFAKKSDIPSIDGLASKDWVDSKDYLTQQSLSKYVKKTDLNGFASKDWVTELLNSPDEIDLSDYAKKSDLTGLVSSSSLNTTLKSYAKKSQIPDVSNFVTKDEIPSVDGLASKDWVEGKGYLTQHQSLSGLAKKSDIPDVSNFVTKDEIPSVDGLASKDWVEGKGYLTQHQSLSGLAKKSDIPDVSNFVTKDEIPSVDGLATQSWVEGRGYLTQHQSLKDYAKKDELPDLSGYATEQWIQEQGFISEVQDLGDYAKKSDLTGFVKSSALDAYAKKNTIYDRNYIDTNLLSKVDAEKIYPTKVEVADKYLSKSDAKKEYLKIEDYNGIKDATVINKEYNEKTLEDLEADLQYLRNGFYIVHYNDIVIVEDHKILRFFADGVPQTVIEWIEEE